MKCRQYTTNRNSHGAPSMLSLRNDSVISMGAIAGEGFTIHSKIPQKDSDVLGGRGRRSTCTTIGGNHRQTWLQGFHRHVCRDGSWYDRAFTLPASLRRYAPARKDKRLGFGEGTVRRLTTYAYGNRAYRSWRFNLRTAKSVFRNHHQTRHHEVGPACHFEDTNVKCIPRKVHH